MHRQVQSGKMSLPDNGERLLINIRTIESQLANGNYGGNDSEDEESDGDRQAAASTKVPIISAPKTLKDYNRLIAGSSGLVKGFL